MTALLVVLLGSLPFIFVLARKPILRRLALRNAMRRPREATLVVLGSLLGAAIITGSLVVCDTINASIKQIAHAHLGPIDELVVARGPVDREQLLRALRTIDSKKIDGVLPLATLEAAATSTGPHVLSAPRSQVIGVDFPAARRFGLDAKATGMLGPTPARGHAAITIDLARSLSIAAGDTIAVYAYGERTPLVVDRVLLRRGVAGFWLGYQQDARNVLVSQATFDRIETGTGSGAPAQWYVAVSNVGGVESGAKLTDSVTRAISAITPAPPLSPQIIASKQLALDQAKASGKAFTEMFTAMGSFGVLAGLLLLVNLFVMLAAERKTEMGMARAVGLRRAELVRAFSTEGWLYAVVATTLGVIAGVGLGRAIVAFCQRIFSSTHNRLDLTFTVVPSSIATSFAIALVIATTTIVVMSFRVSRLNIIRAIRDIPEPTRPPARGRWLVAGGLAIAAGAAWAVQAFSSHDAFGELLGPVLVVLGCAPYLGRVVAARHVNSALALLVVGWGVTALALDETATEGASIMLYVAQGVTLTAAAVTFVSFQQERLNALLRRLTGGRSLALRLGLAYPLARRSRTAMTVAMYALVIFILVFITTLASMIDAQVATATGRVQGGYALVVSSSPANPIPLRAIAELDGVRQAIPRGRTAEARGSRQLPNRPRSVAGRAQRRQPRNHRPCIPASQWGTGQVRREAGQQAPGHRPLFRQDTDADRRSPLAERLPDPERCVLQRRGGANALRLAARQLALLRRASARRQRRPVCPRHSVDLRAQRDRGDVDPLADGRRVHDDAPDLPAVPGLPRDGPDRRHRRHRGRDDQGGTRAPPPDRLTTGDRLRLAHDRAQLRHRVEPRGDRGNLDRHRARARDALQHRHPQRCLREDHVLRPGRLLGSLAARNGRRHAPGHGLAGARGKPHSSCRRAANHRLNLWVSRSAVARLA
jgi:ABC-type lipoprotein release transport system permease subunit